MAGFEGLLTGRVLAERYRIEEVIGRGGMAAVYRARDERLGRDVAVKVMTAAAPDTDARERMRARFHREAHAAARLQHPNVVTVFDFGTDPALELDFLVMELLHGEDLAARLVREGRLPLDEALRVLRHAAAGVAAGHAAGLVHRDVKPGNIFLAAGARQGGSRVCVLDFGIAQIAAGDDTITSLTRGRAPLSPAYASPEQMIGEQPVTAASDVYSLGVIGYELLAGERPFGSRLEERVRGPLSELRARNPEVSAEVAAVIERALTYDPTDRYSTAAEMVDALEAAEARRSPAAAAGAPASERHVLPSGYRARRRPRLPEQPPAPVTHPRRGTRVGVLLLPLLLAVGLVGWWVLAREPQRGAPTVERPVAGPGVMDPEQEANAPVGGLEGPGSEPGDDATTREPDRVAQGDAPAGTSSAPSAAAAHERGMQRFVRGDYAGAIEAFAEAVRMEPDDPQFRNNLAWALFRAGDLDAAARELDRVLELDPRRDIAHANLGEVRAAQGDTAGAVAAYRRFLELNTDPARQRIARAKLARLGAPPP